MLWAAAPRRTLLLDANRSRWSTNPPAVENNPSSPGPAAYSPHKPQKGHSVLGAAEGTNSGGTSPYRIRPLRRDEPSEREYVLSNGADLRHLLPMGPGDYAPDTTEQIEHDPPQCQRRRPFGSASQRRGVGGVPSPDPFEKKRIPGPGTYENLLPTHLPRTSFGLVKRPVCEPLVMESTARIPPRPPIGRRISSASDRKGDKGQSATASRPTTSAPNMKRQETGESSQPTAAAVLPVGTLSTTARSTNNKQSHQSQKRGCVFSRTPRHFNLHNINSNVPRERDDDFIVPPPGWYATLMNDRFLSRHRTSSAKFTTSPRVIDLARKSCAPGPGAYDLC